MITRAGPGLKLVGAFLKWSKETVLPLGVLVKNLTTPYIHSMMKITQMLI